MDYVCYDSYPAALEALARRIRERKVSFDEYHIVLTPDRYTLLTEKALFSKSGALDCEVLTLSRLCRRVCDRRTLSREGGVMLIANAVSSCGDLEYYSRAAKYPEFARDVYAALLQISSSAVDLNSLAESVSAKAGRGGVTGAKLRDLAKIKLKYDGLKQNLLDSPDRLIALSEDAETSEFIKNAHFYAIGYSDATELINCVFNALARYAKSFVLFDAAPPTKPKTPLDMTVFKATDAISQYKEVASKIRDYVYGGGCYGDVSIVAPDPRPLLRILNEYGVEYYADTDVALFDTAPFSALSLVIKLSTSSPESDRLISLCKNPYSAVDPLDADELESILVSRGIKYNAFKAELGSERASRALKKVRKLIDAFTAQTEFPKACAAVLEAGDFEGVERDIAEKAGAISGDSGLAMTDAVAPIRSLLELVGLYGTGDPKTDTLMFYSAAKSVSVKSLPRFSDRVAVVGAESLRLTACKLLIVVDFNEGVLPMQTADSGLISDADVAATGGVIKPSAKEKNKRSRDELLAVIYNAKKVFCTYYDDGKAKKAALLSALGGKELVGVEAAITLKGTNDPATVAYKACVPSAARELAARGKADPEAVERALCGDRFKQKLAAPFSRYVTPAPHGSISVSELTSWFYCPYKRFLNNTVGIVERKTGELSAPDFGTIIHSFMERFVKDRLYDLPEDELIAKSKEVAADVIDGVEFDFSDGDRARIISDACDYAVLNAVKVIGAGAYEPDPDMIEFSFNGDITLGKSNVPFRGKIDRVDRCGDSVRVIDYKSGAGKEFKPGLCKDGRDMQLPLYAAELKKTGASVTGMFYIPLPKKYAEKEKSPIAGRAVKDLSVAAEYDSEIPSGAESPLLGAKYNTASHKFTKAGQMIDKNKFDVLIDTSVATASLAVDEIESGYIERSPSSDACKRCTYVGLCTEKFPRTSKSDSDDTETD